VVWLPLQRAIIQRLKDDIAAGASERESLLFEAAGVAKQLEVTRHRRGVIILVPRTLRHCQPTVYCCPAGVVSALECDVLSVGPLSCCRCPLVQALSRELGEGGGSSLHSPVAAVRVPSRDAMARSSRLVKTIAEQLRAQRSAVLSQLASLEDSNVRAARCRGCPTTHTHTHTQLYRRLHTSDAWMPSLPCMCTLAVVFILTIWSHCVRATYRRVLVCVCDTTSLCVSSRCRGSWSRD
jgi:hypothetical protein